MPVVLTGAYVSLWEAEYDFVHTVAYLCVCVCVHFFHRLSLVLLPLLSLC